MISTDLETEECCVSRSGEPKKKSARLRSIKLSRLPSLKTSTRRGKSQSDLSSDHSSKKLAMKQAKSQLNPGEADGSLNCIEASSCNSESGFDFNDKNRKCLVRKSSMKPVRILTKTVSLRRKKRPSVRRASVYSSGSPVEKPTCSSTFKGSKFPDDVEIQPAASGVAVKKVCPYTYCSLHGHKKHEPSPPLKRFLSTRRRQLIKSQKGTKPENQNQSHQTQREKQSDNKKKGGQNRQTVKNGDLDVEETGYAGAEAKSKEVTSSAGDDESVAEVVSGETSYPLIDSMENLQIDSKEEDIDVSNLDNAHNDDSEEDDLTGVASEPSVASASFNNSWRELPVAIEDRERVSDAKSSGDEETNTQLEKQNSQTVNDGDLDVEDTGYAGAEAESKDVISSAGDDENVAEVVLGETSYPHIDSMENLQIDLKEEDIAVSNLDNAHNDDSEEDDLTGVSREPSIASASAAVNSSLRELLVVTEDGERVSDTQSSRDEETNTQLEKQNSQTVNNGDFHVEETDYAGAEAESKEVISSAGDDESVAEVVLGETSCPFIDPVENLQIDLKEEDNSHNTVSDLDNAHNEDSEEDGVAGETSAPASVNNSLQELPVAIEYRERVSDTQSSGDEETNTQLESQNSQTVNDGDLDVEETGYAGAKAGSKEVISSAGDDESVAEVVLGETPYPLIDSIENLQIDLKEEDSHNTVSNLDNARNDDLEEDDLTGVVGEPSAPASVNNSLQELPVAIEDGERVSDAQSSCDEETNTQLEKQNYSSLWNLIYRHMASDIAATDGALDKVNKGENVEADNALLRVESKESDQGNSKSGGDEFEDHESGNQEIELNQTDAIKLVQEAINRILFPETTQLSSYEVSVTGEMISDQEHNEQHHGEDKEMGITSSRALGEDKFGESDCKMLPDQEVLLKSKLRASKRWSNLKKVILLKRFVKALERMRNFNPRKPQYLPVEADPEAEKVSLRRQTTEERKNTDEWMLDYALRQVISKLAPAQKKRVALLINAFETVIPPAQSAETPRFRINLGTPSSVNPAEVCTEKENSGGNLADTLQSQVTFPEIKERTSGGRIEAERETTETDQIVRVISLDDGGKNFIHDITKPMTSISSSNGEQFDAQSASSTLENNKVSTAINNVISSHSVIQTLEPTASYKIDAEAKPANKVFPELSPPQESDPDCSNEVAQETPLENQNYTRLWYLVYKHIASDVNVSTDGTQPADEAHKKYQSDGVGSDTCGSGQDVSEKDEDKRENDKADTQKKKLQDEAVKLVQEAIDQILLPEVEDRFSDDQSIRSDTTPEQEVLEKNSEGKEPFISTSTDQMEAEEYSAVPDRAQASLISKNLYNQEGQTTMKEGSSISNMRAPKNWSNLKKLILLRRFFKALEKVKKLNLREPQYLYLEPNAEAEKVNLKHQDTEERKKAEEWMLDYAIQQVVTKLSPARKKKVQLLVEAFETVTPPMETETEIYLRRNTAASSHIHPFKSLLGH